MTRAALLPAGSDPFLTAYWLRNFATWAQYIDELHVAVSGALEPEPLAYIEAAIAAVPNATMYHIAHRTDHGTTLAWLIDKTEASHVIFCEDDAFVRRPDVIDGCFRVAEAGGIVATPRAGWASAEVTDAAAAAFGEQYAFWPCFVFVSRQALLQTDRQFGGTIWEAGDTLLGRTLRERCVADTFVWGSYQLRSLGLVEELHDNYRMSGQHIPDEAPWFHVGSLSGGHGWGFMGDLSPERYEVQIESFRRIAMDDACRRVTWWQRAWECADGAIPEYHARYGLALATFRDVIGVSQSHVETCQRENDRLVTWAER